MFRSEAYSEYREGQWPYCTIVQGLGHSEYRGFGLSEYREGPKPYCTIVQGLGHSLSGQREARSARENHT